jgi:hypothetical protein
LSDPVYQRLVTQLQKWAKRADRGFDPEEDEQTSAYWNGVRAVTDELLASQPPDEPEAHPREDVIGGNTGRAERLINEWLGSDGMLSQDSRADLVRLIVRELSGEARTAPEPAKEPQG